MKHSIKSSSCDTASGEREKALEMKYYQYTRKAAWFHESPVVIEFDAHHDPKIVQICSPSGQILILNVLMGAFVRLLKA